MTVCYFGLYNPDYPRNRNNIIGLKTAGVKIIECGDRRKFTDGRYWHLIKKYISSGRKANIILVGFPGHTDVPLAWFLAKIFRKKLVFDAFISQYNTQVDDRKYLNKNSWKALCYYFLDKVTCQLANLVLLDTNAHIEYFAKTFEIPTKKFARVWVGTDEKLFKPRFHKPEKTYTVGFHGYYLPLQGVEYIIKAAGILRKENIIFHLIGRGPDKDRCVQMAEKLKLKNIILQEPIPYSQLPEFINSTDLYLGGPFGGNKKSLMVIPNKVFEALACGLPVIVGESPAMKELLSDRVNCWMIKQADPIALAQAIKYLLSSKKIANSIGLSGRKLFLDRLTTRNIGKDLVGAMYSKLNINL